jgi:hypothetical protein
MTPVSPADAEKARKFHSLVLQKISAFGQRQMAEELKTSESTISRYVASDLERACGVLAVLGLKIVPTEVRMYEPRKVELLIELARDHLNNATPEQFSFD